MTTIHEVDPAKFNEKLAGELKNMEEFKMPEWAFFVKTGMSKSRPPQDPDFWYKRAASMLRQLYLRGVVGVNRMKTKYGGKQQRGAKPEKFKKGGGKIIRTILQQAEAAGFVQKSEGKKKGRELSKNGLEFMNKTAGDLQNGEK